jgi:hypothetical protein
VNIKISLWSLWTYWFFWLWRNFIQSQITQFNVCTGLKIVCVVSPFPSCLPCGFIVSSCFHPVLSYNLSFFQWLYRPQNHLCSVSFVFLSTLWVYTFIVFSATCFHLVYDTFPSFSACTGSKIVAASPSYSCPSCSSITADTSVWRFHSQSLNSCGPPH